MERRKSIYRKRAATYEEQIASLHRHGVIISDEAQARKYLERIGYYRMGFYLHPFEKTYPELGKRRRHEVKTGTRIEDVVALYFFDFDLRSILNKYLSMIEVGIRTAIIYELSNKYRECPTWFVNPDIVSSIFIKDFPTVAYNLIKKKLPIKRHHAKYKCDYAPAWKTLEFMTLGNLEVLYDNLKWDKDKRLISSRFGEPAIATFKNYLSTIREVRNACAHGNLLFDLKLSNGIKTGMACQNFEGNSHQNFKGALKIVDYFLVRILEDSSEQMWKELRTSIGRLYLQTPGLCPLIERLTGITMPTIFSVK